MGIKTIAYEAPSSCGQLRGLGVPCSMQLTWIQASAGRLRVLVGCQDGRSKPWKRRAVTVGLGPKHGKCPQARQEAPDFPGGTSVKGQGLGLDVQVPKSVSQKSCQVLEAEQFKEPKQPTLWGIITNIITTFSPTEEETDEAVSTTSITPIVQQGGIESGNPDTSLTIRWLVVVKWNGNFLVPVPFYSYTHSLLSNNMSN